MWFRRLLIAVLISLVLLTGRQVWSVAANGAREAIAHDSVVITTTDVMNSAPQVEDIESQISTLRALAYTGPLLLEFSPSSATKAINYLDLERERMELFARSVEILNEFDHVSKASPEAELLRFEFEKTLIEYHRLLPEIDAAKKGVPSAIAQALDPLH